MKLTTEEKATVADLVAGGLTKAQAQEAVRKMRREQDLVLNGKPYNGATQE